MLASCWHKPFLLYFMEDGFLKLSRTLLYHRYFQDAEKLRFWIWCLLKATHTKHKVIIGNETIELEIGQFVTGRKKACEELHISEQAFRTLLNFFSEREQKLTSKTTSKYTIVTIKEYSVYNPENYKTNQQINHQLTSVQPAPNQQLTTYNKDNKDNKEKKLYMECVYLSDEEYEKLLSQYKEAGTKQRIENLNLYIMSKGKKYKSHYHTILSWERKNDKQDKRSPADITKENLKQFMEEMTNGQV